MIPPLLLVIFGECVALGKEQTNLKNDEYFMTSDQKINDGMKKQDNTSRDHGDGDCTHFVSEKKLQVEQAYLSY